MHNDVGVTIAIILIVPSIWIMACVGILCAAHTARMANMYTADD